MFCIVIRHQEISSISRVCRHRVLVTETFVSVLMKHEAAVPFDYDQ